MNVAPTRLSLTLVVAACALVVGWSQLPVASDQAVTGGWKAVRTLPAPEAHQAAAADERFVYAIGNTQVAKYDRATGERVAVSRGDAQHLNSGFFWKGRLYCAHSNYPAKPEQSQVKVLDVESMELSTSYNFAQAEGSLTWVVRREGNWWVNFASYGDENHKTYLAKLDDDWRELQRWRYPEVVLRQLGRYSLSGGIWDGGDLLVTGHDDPVVFRLRLPSQGDTLQFVERLPVPFTGQGFAVDPAGGWVGIDRPKRQIVFAEAEQGPLRLRVLTYNIHHGEGVDRRLDLERIARVIMAVEPDLVLLQEVDVKAERTKGVDQPAELARLTGLRAEFGSNIPLQGGNYGNAVLSRFPILRHTNHHLPCYNDGEQRGVMELELALPGGQRVVVLATHLDHRGPEDERLASAAFINELVEQHRDVPAVLGGDLNAVPESRTLQKFATHWKRVNETVLPTIPVNQPSRQIDYVLIRPAERWRVLETRVLDEAVASDHRPLLAVLELVR